MRLRIPYCNGIADVPDEAAPRYIARGFVPVDVEPKPRQATKRRTTKRRPKASE